MTKGERWGGEGGMMDHTSGVAQVFELTYFSKHHYSTKVRFRSSVGQQIVCDGNGNNTLGHCIHTRTIYTRPCAK